ncbi:hypothetical protein CRYUN_Cryun22dG0097000 [Craigia yunnanensis]
MSVLKVISTLLLAASFLSSTLAISDTYIIHMDSSAMPKAFSSHHSWYLSTLSSVSESDTSTSKHLYTYTSAINGFSATLTLSELEALKNSFGYISFTPDVPLKAHTTHTSQFLGLCSASDAWTASNEGEDVIIGILDSGIWPESESFSDEGMTTVPPRWKGKCESGTEFNSSLCNKKLVGARFYNKGLLANYPKIKIPMNSTRDTDGHGTHTSSIAAGNHVKGASYFGYALGTARGMAPRAHVAMYKVFWRYGIYASDVIAAMDQAIDDGVDILSISLGFSVEERLLEDDPIAVASFAAMEKGVLVVASAGNDGPVSWSIFNGAPWLLTVGAGSIDREFYGILTLGNGVQIKFQTLYPGNYSQNPTPQELYTRSSFPAAFVGLNDGKTLIDYIQQNSKPRGRLQFQKTTIDILAPGCVVLASWSPVSEVTYIRSHPLFSNFNFDSGTSMATPHVAGVAALVKRAHPDWSPAAIRSAIMTTANLSDNTLSPIKDVSEHDLPATPLDIGAGHINPTKALDPGLVYDATPEDYVKLLCAMNYTSTQIRVFTKSNYNCTSRSLDLNYPSFIAFFYDEHSTSNEKVVQEFLRTVTNVGKGGMAYTAKLTGMDGIKVRVEPQKLIFKQRYEKQSYKLSLEGPRLLKTDVILGYLSWVDDDGKYIVRIPIVATSITPNP